MPSRTLSRRVSYFFFSLNTTLRLALIVSILFGASVLVGYTVTAKTTAFFGITKSSSVPPSSTGARLAERSLRLGPATHPLARLLNPATAYEPIVFTDRPNYFPGETALISGSGFWPNEVVTLQVVHLDDTDEGGLGHEPWNVTADSLGNFSSTWFVDPDDSAGATFRLTAIGNGSGLLAEYIFTDGSANLDTCANGPANAPVQCTGANWENGNLNASKSHYLEGQSVPYRAVIENLVIGNTYTISFEWDTTQGGKHALDYITSFDETEPTPGNNPCTQKQGNAIVNICNPLSFVTTPIPLDPNVAAGQDGIPANTDDISQLPGVITLFNGNALSIVNPGSPYTLDGSYAANSSTSITVQFNATASTAVLAWAGHIATRLDWGLADSAITINGSPYHMRLTDITCSGVGEVCNVGQQDHQLSADAVFFPVELTIIKETNPDDAQTKQFNYTATGSNLGPFSLTPPNGTTPAQTIFNLTDTTARTVTESDPHAAFPQFDLTNLSCTQTDGGLGVGTFSTNLVTRTVSFTPKEGQFISCTFVNTEDLEETRGRIIVDKVTNPSGDPTSFDFTPTYGSSFSLTDAAAPNNSGLLIPGNYSVSETVPAGWDMTSSCTSSIGDTETAAAIELDAGETVTCTFTNTKRGHIIVDKVTNPSGDPQSFDFDANGSGYADFSLTDAAAPNDQTLAPGNYSVSETVPAGWDMTSSCTSSIGDTENAGAIELDAGETVTCTFTNTKRGHIIVDKVTNPSGDPQSFNFDANGTGYVDFSLTDAAAPNDQTLAPGNYSVSETTPSGWDLTSSTCTSSILDTESPGAIELDPGETVTCTFTNTKRGHIIVDKVTNPSGDPQSFNFDANGSGYVDFSLTDAAAPNNQELAPGNYSVSETTPSGWDLTSATCTSSIDDTETPGSLELDAGETVTCTFTNTKRGHIIVDKVTNPSGDPQSFDFDANGAGYVDFSLTDAAAPNDQTLAPGNYSVSETTPSGWDLTSSTCTSSILDTESPGAIELDPGETVTCTFTNTKRGHIVVDKVTNPSGDPASFSFDANGTGYVDFGLTDAATPNDQELAPGSYSVSENALAGWDLISSPCTSSLGHAETAGAINLNAGETVTCTFTNRKRARLIVEKQTDPDGATGSFTFTGTAAGTISDGQNIPVGNLVPGNYTSTESNPNPDFDLTSITCNDLNSTGDVATRTATFRLEPGETVKCTFTNTQRGMVEIDKTVSGQPPSPGQSFTFELRQGASTVADGTVLESKTTDASGNINFTTRLEAGKTYQICEWVFPGWNTNLAGDGPLFVPNSLIPPALPNPNVNNLTVCANFSVQPGQTRTFTVDNTPPPGGRALTIGFWKNWASCASSNGKGQKNMLDLALGFASANTTNPPGGLVASAQNPGALWPNYAAQWYLIIKGDPTSTINNIKPAAGCAGAVALLDKRSIDGKKKMASDPLFNMTAQLIAAQLNRFMGSGINGTTIMNIDRAVLLNGKYKFNGNTYSPKLTTADTNLANCLATQLDNYNNGNAVSLCP